MPALTDLFTGPDFSKININNNTLRIAFFQCETSETLIEFQLNKYEDGSNPQLYTRLPKLEQMIAEKMETIIMTN